MEGVKEINEVSTESLQHNHEGIADFFEREKINVIITGGIGKGAYNPLIERGFKVIRGASGKIEEVLKLYLDGQLQDKNVICNHHHEHH